MIAKPKKKLTLNSIVSKKNRRRQEGFKPEDAAYLNSKPEIKLNKQLGHGYFGEFYTVEGNDNIGVKVPGCALEQTTEPMNAKQTCKNCFYKRDIKEEGDRCKKHGYNDKPMLAATRFVTVTRKGKKCIGLARPILDEVNSTNAQRLTNSQLETIRRQLIDFTRERIAFKDNLQGGLTPSGKFLQFDLGHVQKCKTVSDALSFNQSSWFTLLSQAHKFGDSCPESWECRDMIYSAKRNNDSVKLREAEQLQINIAKVLDKYGRVEL